MKRKFQFIFADGFFTHTYTHTHTHTHTDTHTHTHTHTHTYTYTYIYILYIYIIYIYIYIYILYISVHGVSLTFLYRLSPPLTFAFSNTQRPTIQLIHLPTTDSHPHTNKQTDRPNFTLQAQSRVCPVIVGPYRYYNPP